MFDIFIIYENTYKMLGYRNISATTKKMEKRDLHNQLQIKGFVQIDGKYADGEIFICYLVDPNAATLTKKGDFKIIFDAVMNLKSAANVVIIGAAIPNNTVLKPIQELRVENPKLYLEVLLYSPLTIEVPKHKMYVAHRALTHEEVVELMKKIKNANIPVISAKDPAAIWMGIRSGDIVEIKRKSEISGELTTYRKCE